MNDRLAWGKARLGVPGVLTGDTRLGIYDCVADWPAKKLFNARR